MRQPILIISATALAFGVSNSCMAAGPGLAAVAVDSAYLSKQNIAAVGSLVSAQMLAYRHAQYLLVLTRKDGPSPAAPDSGRIERIELRAALHTRTANGWVQTWTIRDINDCPELDASGGFFPTQVRFSDLDKDGNVEVTVPYHLLCAGGVDPSQVKVIMREGEKKFAIRGRSELRLRGQEPFGGEHEHDKILLEPANKPFREFLDAIWKKVSVDKR